MIARMSPLKRPTSHRNAGHPRGRAAGAHAGRARDRRGAHRREMLGHLPGQQEALGIRVLAPGTLIVVEEASMMSMADLPALGVDVLVECERHSDLPDKSAE
jgi:hypothetical protein